VNFIYDPSLVLYLPLYELDGNSIVSRDACGHLSSVAGALWRPYGRYFDGTDDFISCGNNSALGVGNTLTIEAWCRTGSPTTRQTIVGHNNEADTFCFQIGNGSLTTAGVIMFIAGVWVAESESSLILADVWHHIVYARNGTGSGTHRIFVDGIEKSLLIDAADNFTDPTQNTEIGRRSPSGQVFSGDIGEFRLYNRPLTPPEVQRNYLATKWRYR